MPYSATTANKWAITPTLAPYPVPPELPVVSESYNATLQRLKPKKIIVYKHNGDKMKFLESKSGIYYYDAVI